MASKLTGTMKKLVDEAPEAGFINVNYGKLTVTPYVLHWERDENNKPMPKREELSDDHELKSDEAFELLFSVDIAEFNPAVQFKYERNIQVRKSRVNKETNAVEFPTDWSEVVEPSLISTFGDDWLEKIMTQPYVEVEDVPNVGGRKSKPKEGKEAKVLTVPKFLRVFKSRAECETAHKERYGDKSNANGATIPEDVINKTRGLLKSMKGDRNKVIKLLSENKPFGDYDPEEILALAEIPA